MDNIAEEALTADRLDRAMRMRARGKRWDTIARDCGYESPQAAFRAVSVANREATMRAEVTADELRDEANMRLDYLLEEAMSLIEVDERTDVDGNPVGPDPRVVALRAIDEARRVIESKNKLNRLDKDAEGDAPSVGIRVIFEDRPNA